MPSEPRRISVPRPTVLSIRVLRLAALSYVVGATGRTLLELATEVNWNPATLLGTSAVDVGMFLVWNLLGFTVWRPVRSAPGNLAVGLVVVGLARWWIRTRE